MLKTKIKNNKKILAIILTLVLTLSAVMIGITSKTTQVNANPANSSIHFSRFNQVDYFTEYTYREPWITVSWQPVLDNALFVQVCTNSNSLIIERDTFTPFFTITRLLIWLVCIDTGNEQYYLSEYQDFFYIGNTPYYTAEFELSNIFMLQGVYELIVYEIFLGSFPGGSRAVTFDYYSRYFLYNSVPLPSDPVADAGFTFMGWYLDSNFTQPLTNRPITANTRLYARFDTITYNITFNLNGGVLAANPPEVFTVLDTVSLPIPTRTGHNFLGWYTNGNFTGGAVTHIEEGTYRNRYFYARWAVMLFRVEFIVNGVVWQYDYVEFGSSLVGFNRFGILNNAEWFLDEDFRYAVDFEEIIVEDNIRLFSFEIPRLVWWQILVGVLGSVIMIILTINLLAFIVRKVRGKPRARR